MPLSHPTDLKGALRSLHPYDALPAERLNWLAGAVEPRELAPGAVIYEAGQPLEGLFILRSGEVEVIDGHGVPVSLLGPGNSFGERGLMRDGRAATTARATAPTRLLLIPRAAFDRLVAEDAGARAFFDRARKARPQRRNDLATARVESFMAPNPLTCTPETPAREAARLMRARGISSLCVLGPGGALAGIVTIRDMSGKVVGEGLSPDTPVAQVMTASPITLPPEAIGSDVLHTMVERRVGHVPILRAGALVGIVTQTDLTRFQAVSSAELVAEIATAPDAAAMAEVTARIPQLLVQLVAAGNHHEVVTRLITDIADTATRRLLALAEARLGPPPVPYLWAACGSQGRQEQTGVSDQDNCLILDEAAGPAEAPYFEALARFVCDGLNTCGYVYCPGEMMATAPRWRQPLSVWRGYFNGWIDKPNPEAQMLASVMFDLRAIGGQAGLLEELRAETLARASKNSIFVAHMISNALKHHPPLGLMRGLATIRSGEHKNQLDLKHNGVVPVVDLGRLYAIRARLGVVNTRARLAEAQAAGVLSATGGRDLLDAYDLIAETRLEHQARQIRADTPPDNFMAPSALSDFERSHLRDAFVVVKSLQSALGQGVGPLG